MDDQLFGIINGWAGQSPLLDSLMINITSNGPYVFAGTLVLFLFLKRFRAASIMGFGAVVLAVGINFVLKYLFFRPRPFVQEQVRLLLDHAPNSSFPSNHTTAAIAIACTVWYYNRKVGSLLIGFALLMGISRVYVGHHYPTDVFAGMLLGVICAVIVLMVVSKLVKGKKEQQGMKQPSIKQAGD